MGRYDQIIDWFKQRHDTLLDDLEPLESGLRRMMEFDGYDWRDVTPQLIAETKRKIEELELLVTIYEGRNAWPSPMHDNKRVAPVTLIYLNSSSTSASSFSGIEGQGSGGS
jgi:hypothetical protein